MKKVIRLTESDLIRIVKRIINEQNKFDPNDLLGPEDTIDDSDPDDEFYDEEYYNELLGPEDTIDGSDPDDEQSF